MFPIANDQGRVIAFTGRTLATDEKAGPKYLNSPETADLFEIARAFQSRSRQRSHPQARLRHPCRRADGLHLRLRRRIPQCDRQFRHRVHRTPGQLLGRFSKNVVVNFDPDTAGARATERTLGLLVEEEFNIKVLTLETGFDPDLYIRRKGKDAYAEALRHSQRYFDYLIERARAQFPVRSPEGKVKAVNHLLPHIQRVPSRIVRDELAHEISQKLGIDSAVLRQELKHVASSRSAAAVKSPAATQITDAEKILISALASATQMQTGEGHLSARDGAEEEFDPARQARFALSSERLHEGMATESLLEALLKAGPESPDPMDLPIPDPDRRLIASVLMNEAEELTAERLEGAVRALRKMQLRKKFERVQQELQACKDPERMKTLLQERVRLKQASMRPRLSRCPELCHPEHLRRRPCPPVTTHSPFALASAAPALMLPAPPGCVHFLWPCTALYPPHG